MPFFINIFAFNCFSQYRQAKKKLDLGARHVASKIGNCYHFWAVLGPAWTNLKLRSKFSTQPNTGLEFTPEFSVKYIEIRMKKNFSKKKLRTHLTVSK